MADEKESLILELKIDRTQSEKEIDEYTKSIQTLNAENEKLLQLNKDLKKSGQESSQEFLENQKRIELNKDAINRNTSARKNSIQAIKAEDNSLGALKARLAAMKAERDRVNLSTEAGTKKFHELTKAIKADTDALLEAEKAAGTYTRQVGNYEKMADQALQKTGAFGGSVDGLKSSFTALINPITASVAAAGALVALYAKSTVGAKDLAYAQDQLGAAMQITANAVGRLVSGDGSGEGLMTKLLNQSDKIIAVMGGPLGAALQPLIKDLLTASKGIADIQKQLRESEIGVIDSQGVGKQALNDAEQRRRIRDDANKTHEERMRAAREVEGFINVREQVLLNIQKERLGLVGQLLEKDKNNLELQREYKQIQFEIRDIQEDSQGQRTEALNGILALENEIRDKNKAAEEQRIADLEKLSEREREIRILQHEEELQRQAEAHAERLRFEEEFYTKSEDIVNSFNKRIAANSKKYNDEKSKNAAKLADTEKQIEANKIAFQEEAMGRGAQLFKEKTVAYKVLASGQAVMDTYKAANMALSSLPPPFSYVAAALAVATGLANVAKINSVKFARGGEATRDRSKHFGVGGKSHALGGTKYWGEDGNVFEVERGEGLYVLNRRAEASKIAALSDHNQRHGGVSFANRGWYRALGGAIETRQATAMSNNNREVASNMFAAIQQMPAPIVLVEDIQTGVSSRVKVEQRSQVI